MGIVLAIIHKLAPIAGVAGTLLDILIGAILYFATLIILREEVTCCACKKVIGLITHNYKE